LQLSTDLQFCQNSVKQSKVFTYKDRAMSVTV